MASPGAAGSIRLDKLLWFLRFARSRSLAQAIIAAGHIRLDGRRVTRSSCAVHAGATLVLPVGERIEVIRLLTLPGARSAGVLRPARSGERPRQLNYRRARKSCRPHHALFAYRVKVIRNCRFALTRNIGAA
jgi:ribosome-associated heat shock protein Hsp15